LTTRIVELLDVRDPPDVVDAHVAFQLNAGVDFVVATDLGSPEETSEVLESHAREGHLRLLSSAKTAAPKATGARLAAEEHGADWVIESDATEFWWPRGTSLGDVLDPIPDEYSVVQALVRHFVPVVDEAGPFFERMTFRLSPQAVVEDPVSPLRPFRKLVRRPHALDGANDADETTARLLRGWYPVEILRFSGPAGGRRSGDADGSAGFDVRMLEDGLASGVIQLDLRLRDALRALAEGGTFTFPRATIVDDALFAVDTAVLGEADVLATQRRLDELERRLAEIEGHAGMRLERRLRSAVRRVVKRG
jgi:hypothetical protein